MRLYDDWRRILRKAWSIRFILLAGLLTGCEAVIQITGVQWLPGPEWLRSVVVLVLIGGAFVSRLVAQKDI
jgi:hypothetical protein